MYANARTRNCVLYDISMPNVHTYKYGATDRRQCIMYRSDVCTA